MKRLLSIFLLTFSILGFSQIQDEVKKLEDIVAVVRNNMTNTPKLDSVKTELKTLSSESTNLEIRKLAKETISMIDDLKSTLKSAKSQTTNVDNIEKSLIGDFRINDDKFKKITFITGKKALAWNFRFYPYISIKEGLVRLRLHNEYSGKDWIFFDTVKFIVDGKDYEYSAGTTDTQVSSGVYETSDVVADDNIKTILENIANSSSKVEYRLTGKYYKDLVLTEKEKELVKRTLQLYQELTK